ncbi:hypothetical protein [Aquimarina hainanensis]|uniref:hypothetical protein n=1 Tax=Aquimarina hainanensis TaxID=1578017 RepID=UPI00360C6AE0
MDKRKFLKTTILASTGIAAAPSLVLSSCNSSEKKEKTTPEINEKDVKKETSSSVLYLVCLLWYMDMMHLLM